jgi:hypothetical protein
MNTVIIPAYNRPEFVYLCLERIKKADNYKNNKYIVALDYGFNQSIKLIVNQFSDDLQIDCIMTGANVNRITKQSYNVLNALIYGAKHSDNLVYLIEDDVMIGKDFFTFNEELHAKEKDIFCSVLSMNVNTKYNTTNDFDKYYISANGDYQSIGVCYKKEIIMQKIKPHFTSEYISNPFIYCKNKFPDSKLNGNFVEQDGLIRRIIEAGKERVAYAHVPRCYHAGFYGKNRGKKINDKLNIQQRIDFVRNIIFSKENMKAIVEWDYFYYDSEPINLENEHFNIQLQQCEILKH